MNDTAQQMPDEALPADAPAPLLTPDKAAHEPMVVVENLVFEYPGKRVLDNISFTLPRQSITALTGANGVGKTTLMRCLAALHTPFSGRLRVAGVDVVAAPRLCHRRIGYLADFFGLYDDLTVYQCLSHAARAHGVREPQAAQLCEGAIHRLGLQNHCNARAGQLSRGMRQRLAIGQAIVHEPEVLLLDEPASGLDPEARRNLSQLLLELRDYGMTLLVSSHILAELEEYSTHLLILRDSRHIHLQQITENDDHYERRLRLSLAEPRPDLAERLAQDRHVEGLESHEDAVTFLFHGGRAEQHALLRDLLENGFPVCCLSEEKLHLSDAYMRGIRNADAPRWSVEE
ncbi:ABC transporter ATP-binding protein [Magnetofaba australis]|uniref:Putative ABC transporter n=1 Tax=Magnetofaba australis IT-1 TaxID=1434232 RepID=A0A1Y2K748_9PROT|nr:ABC transporter ATP-binding protein [Magnetofaba australis]OSM05178.1 putative ABC transporter [Magnetofaba australis IT-1]